MKKKKGWENQKEEWCTKIKFKKKMKCTIEKKNEKKVLLRKSNRKGGKKIQKEVVEK